MLYHYPQNVANPRFYCNNQYSELKILKYFAERKDEIVTREELLNHVWGYDSFPNTRTVDTHIANLRQKIEDSPDDPKIIKTIYGLGHKLLL